MHYRLPNTATLPSALGACCTTGTLTHRQSTLCYSPLCCQFESHSSLTHSLAAIMLVLLALNNIRTVLVTLGSLQMFAVVVAWFVLLLPIFSVATEPSVRMIKSHHHHHHHPHHYHPTRLHCTALPTKRFSTCQSARSPVCCFGVLLCCGLWCACIRWVTARQPLWSTKQAMLTKTVSSQFPKSVSEYSGARGSTQHQTLTAVTAVCGTLQICIAFSLWAAPHNVDNARLVVLVVSGICCILIGQMESALPWRNLVDELRPIRLYLRTHGRQATTSSTAALAQTEQEQKQGERSESDSPQQQHAVWSQPAFNQPKQPQQQQQQQQLEGELSAAGDHRRAEAKDPEQATASSAATGASDTGSLSRLAIGNPGPVIESSSANETGNEKSCPEPPLQSFYGTSRFVDQAVNPQPLHSIAGLSPVKQMDERHTERLARFIRDKQQVRVLTNEACSDAVLRLVAPQYTRIVPTFQPLARYDRSEAADGQARRRQQQQQQQKDQQEQQPKQHYDSDEWRIWLPPTDSRGSDHAAVPGQSTATRDSVLSGGVDWAPCQSDGIALRATSVEGGGIDDGIMADDTDPKMKSSAIHMIMALAFVVLNFLAQGILGEAGADYGFDNNNSEQPNRLLSAVLAFTGMGFFLLFAVLSWLTGGYDDVIGQAGKSCCGFLMAREVSPCMVCYSAWPGRSNVQVGPIQYDQQLDSFVVKPRACCAFSACPGCFPSYCRDSHYAVDEEEYKPNWYDEYHNKKGAVIDRCFCTDYSSGACSRALSWCGVVVCLHWFSCCLGRKTGAAMIGALYISLETVAFSLLVLSVAAEAVSVPLHASLLEQ